MQRGSTQTEDAKRRIGAAVSATKQRQKSEIDAMRARIAILEGADTPDVSPEAGAALQATLSARAV